MNLRLPWTIAVMSAIVLSSASPASAQQTLNFSIGYFAVRGEDARDPDDVLLYHRQNLFLFDFNDFNSASLGAEWLVPIGEYAEVGAGIGFTRRTVPTIYFGYTFRDGSEIEQELRLRNVPIAGTIRLLPLGRNSTVQPYVGGGIGVNLWRYSETGNFIDFTLPDSDERVFRESYVATGTAWGPVAVFGLRIPAGNVSFGGEIRYQKAEGDLDELDFLAPKIDLGGFHYSATIGIRF